MSVVNRLGAGIVLGLLTASSGCASETDSGDGVAMQQAALTAEQCSFFEANGKVQICHHTGSEKKPYTILRTSLDGCIDGHAGHALDYVAVDDPTCQQLGCYPIGAPADGLVPCCEGLGVDDAGACADLCAGKSLTPDACHQAGTCDPATGLVSFEPVADGTACDDGLVTTVGDACAAGECGGASCFGVACSGTGDSVSAEPTAQAYLEGVSFIAPEGAPALTITSLTAEPPTRAASGATIEAVSAVYEFGPSPLDFAAPLEIALAVADPTDLTVFWSADGQTWDEIAPTAGDGTLTIEVSHFSRGVVGRNPCAGKQVGEVCGDQPVGDCAAAPVCAPGNRCVAQLQPATNVCRPVAGACDLAELCTGSDIDCPADVGVPPVAESCADLADNDCDGDIDCADADCATDAACVVGGCPPGLPCDPVLWLAADMLDTIVQDGDGNVSGWLDGSDAENHVYQSNAGKQPRWVDGALNGMPVVRFDGLADSLNGGDILDLHDNSRSIYVVGRSLHKDGSYVSKSFWGSAANRYAVTWDGGDLVLVNQVTATGHGSVIVPAQWGAYELVTGRLDRGAATASLDRNGALLASTVVAVPDWASYDSDSDFPFLIGSYHANATTTGSSYTFTPTGEGEFLYGDIAEILIYDRILDASENTTVECYLSEKYQLEVAGCPSVYYCSGDEGVSAETCADGLDNDCDGMVDCFDAECATQSVCAPDVAVCPPGAPCDGSLQLWLEASSAAVVQDGSGYVSNWRDRSVAGYDVTQPTASKQPRWVANGLNGQPVIRFDGADVLSGGDVLDLGHTSRTLFVVGNSTRSTGNGAFLAKSRAANAWYRFSLLYEGNRLGVLLQEEQTSSYCRVAARTTAPTVDLMTVRIDRDPAVKTTTTWVNGQQLASCGFTRDDSMFFDWYYRFLVGGYNNNSTAGTGELSGYGLVGDIAEILMFERVLTSAEIKSVECYLGAKFGLTVAGCP